MQQEDSKFVRPRRPAASPRRSGAADRPVLPDWMRDSKPARPALDQRTGLAGWLQGRWWAWQGRKRLYQRYPIGFKMVAFFASWIAALALLMAVYWLYALA